MRGRGAVFLACTAIACSAAAASSRPNAPAGRPGGGISASARIVRVALAEGPSLVRLTSQGEWEIFSEDGTTPVALTKPGESWLLDRDGRAIRARREDSRPVTAREATVIARPADPNGQIVFNGHSWRGELVISVSGEGLLVVNRLPMDDYLRGVVPLEIGTSAMGDLAAVESQAITARSYAYTHLGSTHAFDMRATVTDQVYGGASAETKVGNQAVESTTGLVLLYGGHPVNAPYSATCGGSTAEPEDAWHAASEPYLKRVSDQIPGTTHFYCENAPRYRWTQRYSRDELKQSVARYVRNLPGAGSGVISAVRTVAVTDVTPAGRVSTLTVETDRGAVALHGNDIRAALRLPSGEILYSTYFSVDAVAGRDGVESLTLHGGGNGHGVGMCQAGAIGRARAGQDYRTILQTYYPGTIVGTID